MHRSLLPVWFAAIALVALGACAGDTRPAESKRKPFADPNLYSASEEETAAAFKALTTIENELAASQAFDPEERERRQKAMGQRLERLVAIAQNTRHHNKALYLLAHWRFAFRDDGTGVEEALDALDALPTPPLKQLARPLRIKYLLRQGRVVQARTQAEALVRDVPELGGVLDLVTLYEKIGHEAPPTLGRGLDDQPLDPLDGTTKPVLLLLVKTWNAEARFQVRRYAQAAGDRYRVAVWVADGSPEPIRRDLPAGTVGLYVRTKAEADAWFEKWIVPDGTAAMLIDPQRILRGVALRPGDLAR